MGWLIRSKGTTVREWSSWGCKIRRWHPTARRSRYRWYLIFPQSVFAVDYIPYRGHMVVARYPRDGPRHASNKPIWTVEESTVKRRLKKEEANRPRSLASLAVGAMPALAPLAEHLGVITFDDGTSRQNGLIILMCQGSEFIALAKDPESELQLRVRASTLDAVLETLALHLSQEDTPWEPDTRPVHRGGPKKGK